MFEIFQNEKLNLRLERRKKLLVNADYNQMMMSQFLH